MALSNWPVLVDDDGSLTLGTVINKAVFDSIKASIEDDLYSAVNPAVTAEDVIDEVVTARGSKASLDERLDIALNEDGTLKAQASLASQTDLLASIGHGNWVHNDDFLIWALGDAVAPTAWTLATVTCARAGSGLADTNTKAGLYCAKLTGAGAAGSLEQNVIGTGSMATGGVYVRGRTVAFGCWLDATAAAMARIYISDGVGTTYATNSSGESYHPAGGAGWQWFSGTHTVALGATKLTIGASINTVVGSAYVSGATVMLSSVAPSAWVPCNKVYHDVALHVAGTLATGTAKAQWESHRPAIVSGVWAHSVTAPTGADILLDFNQWDGAAYQSMFAGAGSRLTVSTTAGRGYVPIDGTYRYRCFKPVHDALSITGGLLSMDIDQVGSGVAGANLYCFARVLQYARPQESLLVHNDWY